MKLFHKDFNYKSKDYMISIVALALSICTIVVTKTFENNLFSSYFDTNIKSANSTVEDDPSNNSILDADYYNTFIGLETKDLFEELESSFWQISESKENYTTYQNENGNTITIYYNELHIIENIDILGLDE